MRIATNKLVIWLLLFTFPFQYIILPSYDTLTVEQLIVAPFYGIASIFSPDEASAQTPPDPNDYTVNKIPERFIDISLTGTEILPNLSDDGGISGVPILFGFEYFGTTFNTITITANGYLTFSTLISSQNTSLPSAQIPDNLIAPFWDDLNPELTSNSAVYYETSGTTPERQFIVEWKDIPIKSDPNSRLTFEVILFEGSNEIQFHYLSMVDGSGGTGSGLVSGSSASIGIENSDGSKGKEVAFNQDGAVASGSAFSFTMGGNAFQTGRLLGDLDQDNSVTVLDQSILTDTIIDGQSLSSLKLLLSDIAPYPGTGGRVFGDGIIDDLDHTRLFEVIMGRVALNPTLSGILYYIAPVGEILTIFGSGFDPVASNNIVIFVDVNGNETTVVAESVNADGTELTVTVPSGLYFVSIRVEHNSLSSNYIAFALEGVPLITSLTPDSGQEGDSILIRGYEFGLTPADNQVSFNGTSAAVNSVRVTNGFDELTVTVPSGITTGPVTVTVGGQTSNGVTFTFDGPPVVAFDSPAEDDDISALTDIIGTASDLRLVSYALEYAPVGGNFTSLTTGTSSVVNGTLGAIDPTLLSNGFYQLRLTAEDSNGNISRVTRNIQVSGQNKAGVFTMTFTDLQIPVGGIPITINRVYDSRERNNSKDFGYGWEIEVVKSGTYKNNRKPGDGWFISRGGGFFNWPCTNSNTTKSHITEIRFSDTEFYRFAFQVDMFGSGSMIGGGCLGTGHFVQIGGVPGANLAALDFSGDILWLNGTDYVQDFNKLGSVFEPQDVRLTTIDGRTFDINLTGGLTRIGDTNGNSLFINNNGVVHSSGKSIIFTRDGQGRLTQIIDPSGEILKYEYNANGNLSIFTDRENNATNFTYDSKHLLLEVKDHLGNLPVRNEYDSSGRLTARIDADGNRTEFSIDVGNNTTGITDPLGQTATLQYDNDGHVTKTVDDSGETKSFTYDSRENKTSETDELGNTRTFTYDANDNLLSETDALGNTISYTYDAKGRLLTMTDANGNVTSNTYDTNGNLLTITDANGVVTNKFVYDASGNMTQVTTLGGTSTFTYDTSGNITRRQGPGGLDITNTYDANGNKLTETVVRTTGGGVVNETTIFTYNKNGKVLTITDPDGNVRSFTYNPNGQVLTETDPRGNTTSFEYDARGNLAKKTYPDGTFEVFGYDLKNRLTAKTDQAGRTTFREYDSRDRLTRILYPDGSDVRYTYDGTGNMLSFKDNRNNTTTYKYDAAYHLTKIINPLGNETSWTYNALGVKKSQTDPLGNVTQFGYDKSLFNAPRLNLTTLSDGKTKTRTYDISGHIASETDEAGNTTTYKYDAAGNLIKVIDALGNETTYTYDEAGNQLSQTDAIGNTTTFEYDANRNMIKRTLPLGMSETMTYDEAGNMISKTDFNGNTTTYTYDAMNRLISETLPSGNTITRTYTPTGKLKTSTDTRGVTRYTYDLMDRVVRIDNPDGTSLIYEYDASGNRTSVQSPAGKTTYTYDAANRLKTVTDPDGGITTYSYDAAGNKTKIVFPNGTETHYTYDSRSRLIRVAQKGTGGSTALAQFDYLLDPVGNRTRITDSRGRVTDYSYDALYRLVKEVDGLTTTTYTYDKVGNRLTRGVETYTYDANNRLLSAGTETFTYDSNGNMLTKTDATGITRYSYDSEDRLIKEISPSGIVTTFIYDAEGNRVSSNENGTITNFVVDPYDNSGYSQVLADLDSIGNIRSRYVYGSNLLSIRQSGASHYYHSDALGSIRLLTDSGGSVTDTYDYDAFGNIVGTTGSTPNSYRFAGERYDSVLGLYYLRARYMSPQYGRFVTSDPFSGSIFDPSSLHKYIYARNNPVNLIDPSGQFFSMGSVMVSVSIVSTLSSIALPAYGLYKDISDTIDKVNTLLEEIPRLKLNKTASVDDLKTRIVTIGPGGITLNRNLGDGAVEKAYEISSELVGGTGGELLAFIYSYSAGLWMSTLTRVDDKPAHYLSCGFNDYIFQTYQLQLVNGIVTKPFKPALQIIGAWLNYFNLIALMANTLDDSAYGSIPPQPPSGRCPIPGS